MIGKFYVLLILVFSTPVVGDVQEDVVCFLSENIPKCDIETTVNKFRIVLEQPSSEISVAAPIVNITPDLKITSNNVGMGTRDWISIVIAIIALLGFLLNVSNFYTQKEDRVKDIESEKFNFWLKEIIFPNYIEPVLKALSDIDRDYAKWINEEKSEKENLDKNIFLEAWPNKKVELLEMLPQKSTLPYLGNMFVDLRKKILELDDHILTNFLQDEIFSVDTVGIDNPDEGEDNLDGGEESYSAVSSLIEFIYSQVIAEQGSQD